MGNLERRLESLEAARMRGAVPPAREELTHLSDEDLDALAGSPDELLEEMKRWEAEVIERQRRNAEQSRRRDRALLERNRALIGTRRR